MQCKQVHSFNSLGALSPTVSVGPSSSQLRPHRGDFSGWPWERGHRARPLVLLRPCIFPLGCLQVAVHWKDGRLTASSAPSGNFPLCLHLFRCLSSRKQVSRALPPASGWWKHWQIRFKNPSKETVEKTWHEFAMQLGFALSLKRPVVIWTIHQPQSGLCPVLVASIFSCPLFLPHHNVPTVADTATWGALFELHTFAKHPDMQSQGEVFLPCLPSLMKRFGSVCRQ